MITSFSQRGAIEFREEVRTWLQTALPQGWIESRDSLTEDQQIEIRREWDRTLFKAGYGGLSWPPEYGGRGAGPVADAIFYEELARAGAPDGLSRLGRTVAGPLIMTAGSEEQQSKYLPEILDGSSVWCLCLSEPDAGSDLANVSTSAILSGSEYVVNGTKIWTSFAQHATRSLLLARTGSRDAGRNNLTMFLMPMNQPGVQIRPIRTIAGDHHFNEVTFDSAVVPVSDRLGGENDGWNVFRASLTFERGPAIAMSFFVEMCRERETLIECCAADEGRQTLLRARELASKIELVRWHLSFGRR
jgi:alkylation response protein AidB-like acyl-CoA dehydrogenase